MTYARRTWQHNFTARILLGGAAVLSGCFTPARILEIPTRARPERTNRVPYTDIAALTTETLIERHRSELERLADATRIDDIERGGVIIDIGGATELVEIHNSIRDGPELLSRYTLGAYNLRQKIEDLLTSAIAARKNCAPESTPYYAMRETQFINTLANIPGLPAAESKAQADQARIIYAELALHCTYLRNSEQYERVKKRGRILFHVHTHHDGAKRETLPEEDPLRPSRQDLLISDDHEGIVSGVDATGRRMLYHTHKGKYRIIRSENALALR